jgi:putative hydrolase of the HAD superfamily
MTSLITTLFVDVGGVLLTNAWDRQARQRAAEKFKLDLAEMSDRHALTFDTYEAGKLSLDDYLTRVVFYEERGFSRDEFKAFMFEQSQRLPDMIEFVQALKRRHKLRVAVISNEGRELTAHRVRTFPLADIADFFIFSCYVHLRKPDADIFRLALNVAQAHPAQVAYLDDRPMFAEVATSIGIHGVHHKNVASTRSALAQLGLALEG